MENTTLSYALALVIFILWFITKEILFDPEYAQCVGGKSSSSLGFNPCKEETMEEKRGGRAGVAGGCKVGLLL